MAEAVKVIVRCRPMNKREKDLKCQTCLFMDGNVGQCRIVNPNDKKATPKMFTFDGAYYTDSITETIYADIGYPLVEGVTEGYNGTIFAYGQTGCGKSFSMQGIEDPPTQRGIIPRAFDHIFETVAATEGCKFLVHASYLEIYNEEIRDLLGTDYKTKIELKEHPDKGIYCPNLSKHACKNVADCDKVMASGWKNRSVGATLMNAESSRSHSIFTIYLERAETDEAGEEHIRAAKLNLVDLAGSERQGKTGATGDRLKEATKINLSLSALGNVISALVDGKSKHIPYRDSKLTRLLQDSLGGNTKTLMVACLSPADNNYDETLSTLRYANRAKNIKNKPKINEDPKDALLREYGDEIKRLKAMLRGEIPVNLDASAGAGDIKTETKIIEKVVHVTNDEAEKEKIRLQEEYDKKIENMKEEFEGMRIDKEKLEEEMALLRNNYDKQIASVDEQGAHIASPGQAPSTPTSVRLLDLESGSKKNSRQSSATSSKSHVEEGIEEPAPSSGQAGQRAVHLASKTRKSPRGAAAPHSSPTELMEGQKVNPEVLASGGNIAIQRLQELEQAMVGGEQANNEEVKERRRKKKRHAEERRLKLAEALNKMDDSGIMAQVYENIQDEVRAKNKIINTLNEKVRSAEQEVADLQTEFEYDRTDYLDAIRKQELEMKFMQALIDKIHPCLRKDCNYTNLDRIRAQATWDEEMGLWRLPKMTVEKTKLPPTGIMPGAREPQQIVRPANIEYDEFQYEDRYLQKLHNGQNEEIATNYFKSKRKDKLLNQTSEDKNRDLKQQRSPMGSASHLNGFDRNGYDRNGYDRGGYDHSGYNSGGSGGYPSPQTNGWQIPPDMTPEQMKAAVVHGQMGPSDEFRKPQRLNALAPTSGKPRKKKNRTPNTMEHY